uniref:Helix-turn-helix domain-containing protein n=1 Tax=Xenopus tropicalis TaxID=8364 RepID=A0A803JYE2_XENTR
MDSDQFTSECIEDRVSDIEQMSISCPIDFQDECAILTLRDLYKEGSVSDMENLPVIHTDLRSKSGYYPVQSKNYYINLFQKLVQQDIDGLAEKWGGSQSGSQSGSNFGNLTVGETRALRSLSTNRQIVIKAADKGGSVVVMDAGRYEREIMRQLSDTDTYTPLDKDPTDYFQKLLGDLLSEGLSTGILSNKEYDYLHCTNPTIPIFHTLSKVHKSLEDVKGRPIVAGIGSLNEGLSCYIDKLLMPLVLQLPTFLRDTTMCINKLADLEWKPTYRWFSMDVAALYSSIDHTLGLHSIQYWLQQEGCFPSIQIDFILQAVHFLLYTNYFLFDGRFYLQRRGAAMGTSFAPTYANLFMGWWERLHVFGDLNPYRGQIVRFYRYIDDCKGVWDGDVASLHSFVSHCNEAVDGIEFTYDTDPVGIPFLDVVFSTIEGVVTTDLYRKPITRNTLLHAKSGHPRSCIRGIPVGQFLRLRRICSTWDTFQQQAMRLWDRFAQRGYATEVIKSAYDRAVATDRMSL